MLPDSPKYPVSDRRPAAPRELKLIVSNLRGAQWAKLDAELAERLFQITLARDGQSRRTNIDHQCSWTTSEPWTEHCPFLHRSGSAQPENPLDDFPSRDGNQPSLPHLLQATECGSAPARSRHVLNISADGWPDLATVGRVDTKAFYFFAACLEGRQKVGFTPAGSVPALDGGPLLITPRSWRVLIAEYSRYKLPPPAKWRPGGGGQTQTTAPWSRIAN